MFLLLVLVACTDKRVPEGLVPPPRPPSLAAEPPKDLSKWLIRAAGAEAAGDRENADESWAWLRTLAPDDPTLTAKYARYLTRTGRATDALVVLAGASPTALVDQARGEALVALGRVDEATVPLQDAGKAGLWDAWVTLVDARLRGGDRTGAANVLTDGWTGTPGTATEARARGLRRASLALDATDDLLLGMAAPVATPEDGALLVAEASRSCRIGEVRALAARLDWAAQPAWADAVAALDHTSPCAMKQEYAPRPGAP